MTNDEHSSTRREQVDESSPVPTSHNEGSTGAVPLVGGRPTRREGERTRTRVNLPDALADVYTIVRQLDSGGEGYVLLVEDDRGLPFVAKLYFPNLRFDPRATDLLAAADPAHVVRILDSGIDPIDGSRFEILEWCEFGSLADVLANDTHLDVLQVVREVATALSHVHSLRLPSDPVARLVHQDVKPGNVLVRTLEPLDLVLGDFGLARMIEGSRHLTNRQEGSRAWAPPSGEAITPGWDWWSLGMLIAAIAGGRHPFEVDGAMLSEAAISHHLSQGPVDLSMVTDERVRLLCQGLLTRSTEHRWSGSQVNEWLAGGSPPVVRDVGASGARIRKVHYNGIELTDPTALAVAFQADWDQAQERVAQRSDQGLVAEVRTMLTSAGLTDAVAILDDTRAEPPTKLAKLLLEMNPDLPPAFRGCDIRPGAILDRLTGSSSADEVQRIEHNRTGYLATGILTLWRDLEGMSGGPSMERSLGEARKFILSHDADLSRGGGQPADLAKAAIYAVALNPEAGSLHRASLGSLDATKSAKQGWWSSLSGMQENPYAVTLAVATHPIAHEATLKEEAAEVERVRQARQASEEADRRQKEQREEANRRQREQRDAAELQRRQQEVAARRLATQARFKKWSSTLLAMGLMALWLGAGLIASTIEYSFANWFADGFNTTAEFMNSVRTWHLGNAGRPFQDLDWINASNSGKSPLPLAFGAVLCVAAVALFVSSRLAAKGRGLGDDGHLAPATKRAAVAGSLTAVLGVVALAPWALIGLIFVAIAIATVMLMMFVYMIANG